MDDGFPDFNTSPLEFLGLAVHTMFRRPAQVVRNMTPLLLLSVCKALELLEKFQFLRKENADSNTLNQLMMVVGQGECAARPAQRLSGADPGTMPMID